MRRVQARKYNIHLNISHSLIRYKDLHFLSYTRASTMLWLFPQDLLEINYSGFYFLVHLTLFYMIQTYIDFVYHLFTRKHHLPFSAMPCDEIKWMMQRPKSAELEILSEYYKSDKTSSPLLHSDYRELITSCFLYQLYHDFVQNGRHFTSPILRLVITFMVFKYQ